MCSDEKNRFFMDAAMNMAEEAFIQNEVPVGCLIVRNHQIIDSGYNLTNKMSDSLAHAELICIRRLQENGDDLSNLTFYITLEPCAMCHGILKRIGAKVFFGYENEFFGASKLMGDNSGTCLKDLRCIEILKRFYSTGNSNTAHLREI